MTVGYILVNESKGELINFSRLPVSTKNEICRNSVASKIVSLYMIDNLGDIISFVPDQSYDHSWTLSTPAKNVFNFTNVTEKWIDKAESEKFISGRRKELLSDDEPDLYYWRFDNE